MTSVWNRRLKLILTVGPLSFVLLAALVTIQTSMLKPVSKNFDEAIAEEAILDSRDLLKKVTDLEEDRRESKHLLNLLFCRVLKVLPSGGFCLDSNRLFTGGNELWDGKLCKALEELFGYSSVADFGAGLGHYGRCFLRHRENLIQHENRVEQLRMKTSYKSEMLKVGLLDAPQVVKSWNGWDGAANIGVLSKGLIAPLDLAAPVDLQRRFDWVMSLEVGEHIPAEAEEVFLDNLVKHACKGVVLSWAVPGQAGYNHVNTRSNDHVKSKMADRGLVADDEAEKRIREAVEIGWFKNTFMVFRFPGERC
ncbi:uncharacterized protein LOC119577769 [Penaeus monodon]|uniref:uncharacterized protein LOC119577769 n=1 Tax=Penaeus monodon TaxID=6687 RepID=UPI0018A73D38|nr:uncharacterized protein LOC119577769 [Penaeus monodon]XP_037781252.1 uncharacterized protein LOC119577769 [Penaeus monodon]XP_037781253.1 uncharacterized protein LOC119577769 [Penaeus monodon]